MRSHACSSAPNYFRLKRHALCILWTTLPPPAEHTRDTRRCLGGTLLDLFVVSTPFPSPIFTVSPSNRPALFNFTRLGTQRVTVYTCPLGSRYLHRPPIRSRMQSCGEGFWALHLFFPRPNSYLTTFLTEIALYSLRPSGQLLAHSTFCDALVANRHNHPFS